VGDPVAGEQLLEVAAAPVNHCVVGHDCLWRFEAKLGEEAKRTLERARVGVGVFAWVELDVGDPAVVVDHAVEMVVADAAASVVVDAAAGRAVSRHPETAEFLDVHV